LTIAFADACSQQMMSQITQFAGQDQYKLQIGSGEGDGKAPAQPLLTQHTLNLIAVLDDLAQIAHDRGDFASAQKLYLEAVQEGQLHVGTDPRVGAALCGVLSNASELFAEHGKQTEAAAAATYALGLCEGNPHIAQEQQAMLSARVKELRPSAQAQSE
jgi:hypothetical protein